MLHENNPAKHGCEFSVFFDGRTPSDLMQEGIYSALALALYPGEFQATSVALAALALGATEVSPWVHLKARILDKCNKRKGVTDAQQGHTVPSGQTVQVVSSRSRLSCRSKSAAAEPTNTELSTNLEMAAATRRTSSLLPWQAQPSTPPNDLADLADRAVLLEGKAHWRAKSALYKSTKVQLLSAPGHDGAPDADADAPPWSILVVNGKAVRYEEVTAVKVDEGILEFVVEHTRKYSARSERLHRQHLRMYTRSEFRQWRDALRPEMIKPGGGNVASTSAGLTPRGESGASASAGYHPGGKRAASTPANSVGYWEAATAEEPLVAPTPEAGQGRHSFSQASSSAGPRLSGGSREVSPHGMSPRGGSPRFSGGPRFAGAPPAVVTPAGDETDSESGSDSQASALS